MIKITDVSRKEKYINCELIEKIELVPDTLVTLINGHTFMVTESPEEIIRKIIEYKHKLREVLKDASSLQVEKPTEDDAHNQ